jgi:hypothetical protein
MALGHGGDRRHGLQDGRVTDTSSTKPPLGGARLECPGTIPRNIIATLAPLKAAVSRQNRQVTTEAAGRRPVNTICRYAMLHSVSCLCCGVARVFNFVDKIEAQCNRHDGQHLQWRLYRKQCTRTSAPSFVPRVGIKTMVRRAQPPPCQNEAVSQHCAFQKSLQTMLCSQFDGAEARMSLYRLQQIHRRLFQCRKQT